MSKKKIKVTENFIINALDISLESLEHINALGGYPEFVEIMQEDMFEYIEYRNNIYGCNVEDMVLYDQNEEIIEINPKYLYYTKCKLN